MKTTLDTTEFKIVDNVVVKLNKLSEFAERVLNRREITDSGCWLYTGQLMRNGFAQINRYGKRLTLSKACYIEFQGEVPKGYEVSQTCGNRACFRTEHLVLLKRGASRRGK